MRGSSAQTSPGKLSYYGRGCSSSNSLFRKVQITLKYTHKDQWLYLHVHVCTFQECTWMALLNTV